MIRYEPVATDDVASIIGEGLHTGLRKGTDAPEAHDLWDAVAKSDEAWSDALRYLVWGLGVMDMALCKKVTDEPRSDLRTIIVEHVGCYSDDRPRERCVVHGTDWPCETVAAYESAIEEYIESLPDRAATDPGEEKQ